MKCICIILLAQALCIFQGAYFKNKKYLMKPKKILYIIIVALLFLVVFRLYNIFNNISSDINDSEYSHMEFNLSWDQMIVQNLDWTQINVSFTWYDFYVFKFYIIAKSLRDQCRIWYRIYDKTNKKLRWHTSYSDCNYVDIPLMKEIKEDYIKYKISWLEINYPKFVKEWMIVTKDIFIWNNKRMTQKW